MAQSKLSWIDIFGNIHFFSLILLLNNIFTYFFILDPFQAARFWEPNTSPPIGPGCSFLKESKPFVACSFLLLL